MGAHRDSGEQLLVKGKNILKGGNSKMEVLKVEATEPEGLATGSRE